MTEPWDGQGLPPAARARIARANTDHVRSSLLSIRGDIGMRNAGFDVVGEVMGCIVERIGWAGWRGCGASYGFGGTFGPAPTVTSGMPSGYLGYAPYVDALYRGYDVALHRMLLEAQALGADGVVGVQWTQQHLDGESREFVARGTAVRARNAGVRPAHQFSTDLSGADVAKLMAAGWIPSGLAIGISVAIRHDDYRTRQAVSMWSNRNVEVPGYTELVSYARADARQRFAERAAYQGGDSASITDMSLKVWEIEPSDGHYDHVAQATIVGNALARFHDGSAALTDSQLVLSLKPNLLSSPKGSRR